MTGTVVFAHGRESGPRGTKINHLAACAEELGWSWESPDFRFSLDPGPRIPHLLEAARTVRRPLVLAGSSLGAYVVTRVCDELRPEGLLLMAPALYFPGHEEDPDFCPAHCIVVHGWSDTIVPPERAWRFAQRHGAELHLLSSGHSLNDQLDFLADRFRALLGAVMDRGPRSV